MTRPMNRLQSGPLTRLMRSLRLRLAVTAFLTAYAPTLLLMIISFSFTASTDVSRSNIAEGSELVQTEVVESAAGIPLWIIVVITIGFAPFAAAFAWWWSGRAVRPVAEAMALQERLMEETSHELRTPLAVLSNNAQVLLGHPEPTIEVYRQGLERSEAVAQRMSETLDALLVDARGRARTVDRVPTDVVSLARSVVGALADLASTNGVTLDLTQQRTVEARVDSSSVERAITNLVTNAIQHSPPESTVQLDVRRVGDRVEVVVTDRGPGIDPQDQAEIFERYWQAGAGGADGERRAGVGSGIGLAIVRQVAIAHGGSITVESPVDDEPGARFTLRLVA